MDFVLRSDLMSLTITGGLMKFVSTLKSENSELTQRKLAANDLALVRMILMMRT